MVKFVLLAMILGCGACAGILHGAATLVLVEPYIDEAIAIENMDMSVTGSGPNIPLQTELDEYRVWQKSGMMLGSVVLGISTGALFGVIYWVTHTGLPGRSGLQKGMILAAGAWVLLYLVAFVKYPPALPGIGDPATLEMRLVLHLTLVGMMGAGALACYLWYQRVPRHSVLAMAVFVAFAGTVYSAMPTDAESGAMPGLEEFRLASLAASIIFWMSLGAMTGLLWDRLAGTGKYALRDRDIPSV